MDALALEELEEGGVFRLHFHFLLGRPVSVPEDADNRAQLPMRRLLQLLLIRSKRPLGAGTASLTRNVPILYPFTQKGQILEAPVHLATNESSNLVSTINIVLFA